MTWRTKTACCFYLAGTTAQSSGYKKEAKHPLLQKLLLNTTRRHIGSPYSTHIRNSNRKSLVRFSRVLRIDNPSNSDWGFFLFGFVFCFLSGMTDRSNTSDLITLIGLQVD